MSDTPSGRIFSKSILANSYHSYSERQGQCICILNLFSSSISEHESISRHEAISKINEIIQKVEEGARTLGFTERQFEICLESINKTTKVVGSSIVAEYEYSIAIKSNSPLIKSLGLFVSRNISKVFYSNNIDHLMFEGRGYF